MITLQQRAQDELKKLKTTKLDVVLGGDENLLYLAGWHNGEWTCAKCGTMIGKNLRGESPFLHASEHAHSCKGE